MTFDDQPLFETPEQVGDGYVAEVKPLTPPYGLEVLKPIAPDEYKVFTHHDTLTRLWHTAIKCVANPWAVLGCALAYTSAATEPTVQTPPIVGVNSTLNLLVGIVGNSGAGKGTAKSVARQYLKFLRNNTPVDIPERPLGTGQGIAELFVQRPGAKNEPAPPVPTRVLFEATEIDGLAASAKQQGATIMPTLRKVWSGENIGNTNGNADTSRDVKAHSYRASVVCDIQPARSGALLNSAEVDGGTPQRWVWFDCMAYPIRERKHDPRVIRDCVPVHLPKQFMQSGVCVMEVPKFVWQLTQQARFDRIEGKGSQLDGHRNLTQIKVACLIAIMGGRTVVSEGDWEVSDVLMRRSDEARAVCQNALEENQQQRIAERAKRDEALSEQRGVQRLNTTKDWIVRTLESYGEMGEVNHAGETGLRQRAKSDKRELIPVALEELIQEGHVYRREVEEGGAVPVALYSLAKQ